jgi:peptidoglycan/LPS O-acetylase OafA/YrhL
MSQPTTARTSRFRSLDGLRGAAAMIVVVYHLFEIARPYLIASSGSAPLDGFTPYNWWMTTPASILVAGPQAVYVFFVLSGLVLTLPVIQNPNFDWISYYPRRIVRLYLPALASLVSAVLLIVIIPRVENHEPGGSWILGTALTVDPAQILREATLTTISPLYNGPLWSLYLEVAFSLLLPAFVAFAVLTRRWWWAAAIVALASVYFGSEANDYGFKLLPLFLLGAMMAVKVDELRSLASRINETRLRGVVWSALLLLGLAMQIPAVFVPPLFTIAHGWTYITLASVVGAVLIVFVSFGSPVAIAVLESPVFAWLGKISFSLYLVHVPVLVGIAFLGGGNHWGLVGLIGIPMSLLGGWLFYLVIERPSHVFSLWIGNKAKRRDPVVGREPS